MDVTRYKKVKLWCDSRLLAADDTYWIQPWTTSVQSGVLIELLKIEVAYISTFCHAAPAVVDVITPFGGTVGVYTSDDLRVDQMLVDHHFTSRIIRTTADADQSSVASTDIKTVHVEDFRDGAGHGYLIPMRKLYVTVDHETAAENYHYMAVSLSYRVKHVNHVLYQKVINKFQ